MVSVSEEVVSGERKAEEQGGRRKGQDSHPLLCQGLQAASCEGIRDVDVADCAIEESEVRSLAFEKVRGLRLSVNHGDRDFRAKRMRRHQVPLSR